MSVQTNDMQATVDEVPSARSPTVTLHGLSEVPPPPGLALPPGLSSASELLQVPDSEHDQEHEPIEIKEITPEMKELLDDVSVELTRIADAFTSSAFMAKDEGFEFDYFTTLLPPGLYDDSDNIIEFPRDSEDDDLQVTSKSDGNESTDESTRWSKSSSPDDASNLDDAGSPTESLVSDEDADEFNDEVPELPDLSTKGINARRPKAKKITDATNTTRSTTKIVFGEQGAELAAQVALMAKANAGAMAWGLPTCTNAVYWDPYYGYIAW